jgi:NAD(P)-dependent dehydrogenase (short-subunit alcohol dehydrogenase family)
MRWGFESPAAHRLCPIPIRSSVVVEACRSHKLKAEVQILPAPPQFPFSQEDLATCLQVLQHVSEYPQLMDDNHRFKSLVTKIHRTAKRQKRDANRQQLVSADRLAIESTAIVQQQRSSASTPRIGSSVTSQHESPHESPRELQNDPPRELLRSRHCYVCKTPFTRLHSFYHQLCPDCADFNWEKRGQRAHLDGRKALVTGGRIKIGYQTVLKLLRDGASVLMTTRFPVDAASRFQAEDDFGTWRDRLQIHPLDLRDIPAVEAFADDLLASLPSLDIVIHNAAQTVKRPIAFYQHLLDAKCCADARSLICTSNPESVLLESRHGYRGHLANVEQYFPRGWLDSDGQQIDQRPVQSWMLKLEDVTTIEMLEVTLVNAAAPFVLTSRLKPLLCRSPHPKRFVVNVSAMEGQFSRENKTAYHPHTNMAKAALNMMTRTSAEDFARDGIYMNSVDTGWITDEKPAPIAERVREEHGFYPPLDIIDGAARVYDPIARGCNSDEEPLFGFFLKDYRPYPW